MKRNYWFQSWKKPLRRNINIEKVFYLWFLQLKKFMNLVWHKHNLMISSLVYSGHLGKYLHEIPHECLSGWGNLLGKIISIKRNHCSNLGFFFFKWRFSFSHILRLFQNSFIFGEASSSHFFRVTTSSHHFLFRSSYFFRAAAFLRGSFFRIITFFWSSYLSRIATFSKWNL